MFFSHSRYDISYIYLNLLIHGGCSYLFKAAVIVRNFYFCFMKDPVLFSVSVGENIAYGLPDDVVSKDDIIKAAKAANAHEFIISLPQVGEVFIVGSITGYLQLYAKSVYSFQILGV